MHLLNCEVCGQNYYDVEPFPDEQLCPECFREMYESEENFSQDLIINDEIETTYDY